MSEKQGKRIHTVEHRRVVIHNSHGEKLVGILHDTGSRELVIICHGFRSSKDRIPMINLASASEKQGISAFRFDFAGNGESEGLFQYGNYSREAEDIHAVVHHFQGYRYFVAAVIGHSKGGNAVLMYSARYHDVQTVVNIAGRFDLKRGIEGRLGKDYQQKIEKYGYIQVKNRKGEVDYIVTKESLRERLATSTRTECQKIPGNVRVLTIHGTLDEFVAVEDAMEFDKHITNHKLVIVEGADHEFTKHLHELASFVLDFLKTAAPVPVGEDVTSTSCFRTRKLADSRL